MTAVDGGALGGIIDIEFGPPPVVGHAWLLPALVSLGLLLALAAWVWWWRSDQGRALRRLNGLLRRCRAGTRDRRQLVFQLAALLQTAFGVGVLSPATPLPSRLQSQQRRWQGFNRQLADARYARPTPSCDEVEHLLREGRYWLRRWLGRAGRWRR